MKENIKDLWVEALKSGQYKQTTNYLKTNEGYCCLGVLCDIYAKTQKKKGFQKCDHPNVYTFFENDKNACEFSRTQILPEKIKKWSGVKTPEGFVNDQTYGKQLLSSLNDNGLPFVDIANIIERNWLEL